MYVTASMCQFTILSSFALCLRANPCAIFPGFQSRSGCSGPLIGVWPRELSVVFVDATSAFVCFVLLFFFSLFFLFLIFFSFVFLFFRFRLFRKFVVIVVCFLCLRVSKSYEHLHVALVLLFFVVLLCFFFFFFSPTLIFGS